MEALAGTLTPSDPKDAVVAAIADRHGVVIEAGDLTPSTTASSSGGYQRFDLGAAAATTIQFSRPARVKTVLYPLPDRLVLGHYVEIFTAQGNKPDADVFAYVIAGDGSVLYRTNLVASEAFSYRVWAETTGNFRPLDGPVADFTPHPTGMPDGSFPPFIAPALVTVEAFNKNPGGTSDPWLPPGSTQTLGNNVDAYTDHQGQDGYQANSDLRATTTSPGVFDRTYSTSLEPLASQDQSRAAITQLFFTNNWLHDYWYDSGFDEAAGNAQMDNFGRGGAGADPLHAEAQDGALAGESNNANMTTPADGESPRMQMYLWDAIDERQLLVQPLNLSLTTGTASFGPTGFDLTAGAVLVDDGTAPVTDGCQAIATNLTGKIALIDRGDCDFKVKALNAQAKGAAGVVIINNLPGEPPGLGDAAGGTVNIPVLSIRLDDGMTLKTALMGGAVTITMKRTPGATVDGTIDNMVVAHEWGHYLHHRLVACGLTVCGSMSEGFADFVAQMLALRPKDDFDGTFADSVYAGGAASNAGYFGIRRYPYTTDGNRNPFTFIHLVDDQPLPTGIDTNGNTFPNAEEHNAGEIWAEMLFEGYIALAKKATAVGAPYDFESARRRMADYIVAGMALTPPEPTYTEQRDAILAAAAAADPQDAILIAQGFAKRGAGTCAVSPPSNSTTNVGVVETFEVAPVAGIGEVRLTDAVHSCDDDGNLDAAETGQILVEVTNTGFAPLTTGTVTITSAPAGITFPNGNTANVELVNPFEKKLVPIVVVLDPTFTGMGQVDVGVLLDSPTSCKPLVTTSVILRSNFDDLPMASATETFESSIDLWTTAGDGGTWSRISNAPASHLWHGADFPAISDSSLVTPPLQVGNAPLVMSFQHRHSFERSQGTNWDGAVIEITQDAGMTWQDVTMYGAAGYGGTISNKASNPLADRQGYVGKNQGYPSTKIDTINLGTGLAGKTVQLRFRIGTDEAAGEYGWDVDNVAFQGIVGTPFPTIADDMTDCSVNQPCLADAGPDQTVPETTGVSLNGAASSDPEAAPLGFSWLQVAGPLVELQEPTTATPTFTAPDVAAQTVLTFELTVSDGQFADNDTVDVIVEPQAGTGGSGGSGGQGGSGGAGGGQGGAGGGQGGSGAGNASGGGQQTGNGGAGGGGDSDDDGGCACTTVGATSSGEGPSAPMGGLLLGALAAIGIRLRRRP